MPRYKPIPSVIPFTMSLLHVKNYRLTVLTIAITATLIPLYFMESKVLQHTHGVFAYPLDDTYIHLAVAKNLAMNNIWGISAHKFASASSSILYPLVLAAIFKIAGAHIVIPFVLNIIVAIIFLIVVQSWLDRQEINPSAQLAILLTGVFLTPLPLLIMVGMEHTLHLLFLFLFITSFTASFEKAKTIRFRPKVYIYALLLIATRYESMSVIILSCLLTAFYRNWGATLRLFLVGATPILIFGIYSLTKGSDFIPNSVLLKSAIPPLTVNGISDYLDSQFCARLFLPAEYFVAATQRLFLILSLTLLLFRKEIAENKAFMYMLLILLLCCLFHLCFMIYSLFPRYEAYLIGNSMIICSTLFFKYNKFTFRENTFAMEGVIALIILFIIGPVILRSWKGFDRASLAAISIYDQQYQMGQFVHQYYDNESIAFNDIGAVSYLSHGKNLDLWGLGNIDIARSRRKHYNSPEFLDSISRKENVRIAIVFEYPFRKLLKKWKKVASWDVPYNNASGFDSVSFYAVGTEEAPRLINNLKNYQSSLPPGVIVKYY